MHFSVGNLAILASLLKFTPVGASQSGIGRTTRYWDCCKPSCAWPGKGQTKGIVGACDIHDNPIRDPNAHSGCDPKGGTAFTCSSQAPWAVDENLAYGFAAVSANNPACCQCFELTFTDKEVKGKKMIVQATNIGYDVGQTQFDLAMPGGGFGAFDGCTKEWKATTSVWGDRYGGSHSNTCSKFPEKLKKGCGFRWDWFKGASNPDVSYKTVACPAEIVKKSGCGVTGGPKFRV